MAEPSVFDYWLSENALNYHWQLNLLRSQGVDGVLSGNVATFTSSATTDLARFLHGKSFDCLTWQEVSATILVETPTVAVVPDVVVPTPEPVVVTPPDEPATVVVPDAPVIPAPVPRKTRKPVPHVEPATPAGGDTSNVASPAVPTTVPVDGTSTPTA